MNRFPIIAAVTSEDQIKHVIKSNVDRVILMTGSMMNLEDIIKQLHAANKQVFVHIEKVNGISRDASAVEYLAKVFKVDGIVSTKSNAIVTANHLGIKTIQRIFAIDTAALETAEKMINSSKPDEVELMPGLMPRIIKEMKRKANRPLIVGGLIRHMEEVRSALDHGADYISVGDKKFW